MTRVKVCGITNEQDAWAAVEAGVDALGFVFAPSPRRVTVQTARRIIRGLPPLVTTVGVFVNAPADEVERVVTETRVGVIQLHGDETPECCAHFDRPVIKRFAVANGDTQPDLAARVKGYHVSGYLLDPGAGSGETFPWTIARAIDGPLLIAGGLTPENVRHAVATARPFGVDVSSGVEDRPGKKNANKIRAFVRAVRLEDAELANS